MKSIKFIGWAWPVEVALLCLTGIMLLAFAPDRVDSYIKLVGPLGILIAAQGGAAFGGPAVQRRQEINKAKAENGG